MYPFLSKICNSRFVCFIVCVSVGSFLQQLPILSLFSFVFCVCWLVNPKLVVPHRDTLIHPHMCPRVGYFLRTHLAL